MHGYIPSRLATTTNLMTLEWRLPRNQNCGHNYHRIYCIIVSCDPICIAIRLYMCGSLSWCLCIHCMNYFHSIMNMYTYSIQNYNYVTCYKAYIIILLLNMHAFMNNAWVWLEIRWLNMHIMLSCRLQAREIIGLALR